MNAARLVLLAAVGSLAVLAAGCAALSGPATVPSEAATFPSGAPRVAHPRDLRGVPPCRLLTPAQLDRIGIDPASAKPAVTYAPDGPADLCQLRTHDGLGGIGLTTAYQFRVNGMDRLYRSPKEPDQILEPEVLDGYPALREDAEDAVNCTINVGVADEQLLVSSAGFVKDTGGPSACATARAVASAVLTNLPPLR